MKNSAFKVYIKSSFTVAHFQVFLCSYHVALCNPLSTTKHTLAQGLSIERTIESDVFEGTQAPATSLRLLGWSEWWIKESSFLLLIFPNFSFHSTPMQTFKFSVLSLSLSCFHFMLDSGFGETILSFSSTFSNIWDIWFGRLLSCKLLRLWNAEK